MAQIKQSNSYIKNANGDLEMGSSISPGPCQIEGSPPFEAYEVTPFGEKKLRDFINVKVNNVPYTVPADDVIP